MQIIFIALMLLPLYSWADAIDITPEHIQQMGYKISQPMPCDWDPNGATTIFGYYGNAIERQVGSVPNAIPSDQGVDVKANLFQLDLTLPTQTAFGSYINLEFTPAMMEHDGMPAQIFSIDYKPTNKRCPVGFSPDLMIRQ